MGHRGTARANASAMRIRMVVMELATCRSGRIGGAPWSIGFGYDRRLDEWGVGYY